MKTYETFFRAFSIALSVIVIRLINAYVFKMPLVVGALAVLLLFVFLRKVIEKFPILKKEMNKKTNYILSASALIIIVLSFYSFDI